MSSAVVTARLSNEDLAALDKLAISMDRSRAWIVAKAVKGYIEKEAAFFDFLRDGIDDLEAGRSIPHDVLVDRIKQRRNAREAA